MSIRKSPTPTLPQIAANRENAKKSTGPRTEAGKARAKLNAFKHSQYSASFRESMIALGEDPQEFDRLYRDLLDAYQPTDPLWAKQVDDLAKLYWRQGRWERARSGVLRREMELLEVQQLRRKQEQNRESIDYLGAEVSEVGLRRLQDSSAKFEETLSHLQTILERAEQRDFSNDMKSYFLMLYGKKLTYRGDQIARLFRRFAHPEWSHTPPNEASYTRLRNLLLEEIRGVREEYALFQRERLNISTAARDACLAPVGKQWTWMLRQENALDRAIDRKVKILISYKNRARKQRAEEEDGQTQETRDEGGETAPKPDSEAETRVVERAPDPTVGSQ